MKEQILEMAKTLGQYVFAIFALPAIIVGVLWYVNKQGFECGRWLAERKTLQAFGYYDDD